LAAAAGITLIAGFAGYVAGDRRGDDRVDRPVLVEALPPAGATLASGPATPRDGGSRVPTQFILDAPRATRVSLVGDFNSWDAAAVPLVRDSSSGIWTVTLPLVPGRHAYAFLVDGSTLTLDPRAPTTQDPEFGTPSSVVLVGAP
jgi:hypothetical protein